jgi:mannose-6-phosphate isomerase-like protein (cupin superfamily)
MTGYELLNVGSPDEWISYVGGFRPSTAYAGRRVVDHEIKNKYIGLTVNALNPGADAGYWHTHSDIEELFIFIGGEGQMGLDDDVIDVKSGSIVRVSVDVYRTLRCIPESNGTLQWLCVRAGSTELPEFPNDATKDSDRPMPW